MGILIITRAKSVLFTIIYSRKVGQGNHIIYTDTHLIPFNAYAKNSHKTVTALARIIFQYCD